MLKNPTEQSRRTPHPPTSFPTSCQKLYPNKRLDAVSGQYLHFTQVPHHEKVNQEIGFSKGYQIMIQCDTCLKTMNKVDVKSVCHKTLQNRILLGTNYTNPLDIASNSVTKFWAGFIKMHLKCPHVDGMALLQGTCAFTLELEGGEMVIGKVTNLSRKLVICVHT